LAHTVALAEQQFEAIRAQTPGVQSKLVVGSDKVDAWSTKAVWDAMLLNTRIVVSTYQILFDAVSHAFVPLSSLCLVVVDEGVQRSSFTPTLTPQMSRC
jgi:ERCC4-related helicase